MTSQTYLASIRQLRAGAWLVTCRNQAGQESRSMQSTPLQAFAGATGVRLLTMAHQDEELELLRLARTQDEFCISISRREMSLRLDIPTVTKRESSQVKTPSAVRTQDRAPHRAKRL